MRAQKQKGIKGQGELLLNAPPSSDEPTAPAVADSAGPTIVSKPKPLRELAAEPPNALTAVQIDAVIAWLDERRRVFVQQRTARKAGLRSGQRRRADALSTDLLDSVYERHCRMLIEQGKSVRKAAALTATELKVTARHIRRRLSAVSGGKSKT